jgi:hypothetical protein
MTTQDRALFRFRLRLGALLFLKYALAALTVWAFLWGTAVLALRGAAGVGRLPLLWGLAGVPLALAPAILLARRRLPARAAVRALLDRHGRCGGLLMAGDEVALGGWREAVPEVIAPPLRWRGGRSWALLGVAAGFVLLGFLLPQGFADLGSGRRLEVGREVDQLARQIEVLKKEKVLDPARAEALQIKLERVREEAEGRDPVKTLEALDHLQEMTQKAAREASEAAARKNEELARAETMAETLKKKKRAGSGDKELTEAMKELTALTRKAASEADLLMKGLDAETLAALREGSLSAEQLERLTRALGESKGDLMKRLMKLHKAKLLDREALEKCEQAGKCDCEELAAYLKECGCKGSLCDMVANCDRPGKGGVSRDGPGSTPLTWKEESSADGVKFKEEALPPSDLAAMKEAKLTGLSPGAPQVGRGGAPTSSGALDDSAADGGSASTQVVLPRHRAAVGRYFERAKK